MKRVGLFALLVLAALLISGFGPGTSAAEIRADALVLVNSASTNYYPDFEHYIQPYLDNFGVPYAIIDIRTTALTSAVKEYAVIIVGHRQLDPGGTYLDPSEQGYISSAVNEGTGLVNFDNDLSIGGTTPRYQFVQDVFGFGYGGAISGSGVAFPSGTPHYITGRHQPGETISTKPMSLAGVTLPGNVTAVANTGTQPFLAVTTLGSGRAVQWGSYNWMSTAVKGPMFGLDDLVWRSIVWAARKPFVMRGLPPFVTMRVDDESGGFEWIHIANEFGIKPWAGIFLSNISDTEAADLSALVNSGNATIAIHSFTDSDWFYWDSDTQIAANFAYGTQWHTNHNIPISKFVVPHYYQFTTNAFQGLKDWGVELVGTMMPPGEDTSSPWIMNGPYRLYETGPSGAELPVYYADFIDIPDHPEFSMRFFNCITEIRDDAGYEWYPNFNDVAGSVGRGTRQTKRALDSMALATLFAHSVSGDWDANSPAGWRAILQGITDNLRPYNPIYVTMDYACQYVRATRTSYISSATYDPMNNQVTANLDGATDLQTMFYVFMDGEGYVMVSVPVFSGSINVVYNTSGGKVDQTITFNALPAKKYGDPDFNPGATASSGLLVSYASSNTAVATIVSGKIHIVGAGTSTISASQAGNANYNPAVPVFQTLTVNMAADQTITFGALPAKKYGDPDFDPGATASSGLPISYASSNSAVATILSGKIHIVGAGTSTITASQAGNANYNPAVPVSQTLTVTNPAPTITSLSPSSTTAKGSGFTLTVNGTNFVSGAVVQWGGSARTTTYVSGTKLTASISAADIASAGTVNVTVSNPGGGSSDAQTFTINNPAPTMTSLSPSSAMAGGLDFTLTVNGSKFVSGSVVQWGGSARTTTYVSGTQLKALISAADIAAGGMTIQVTVFNPMPGGGTSNVLTFAIKNPVPKMTSLNPSSVIFGGADFTLTVNGSKFVTDSVVRWKGIDRATTFVSATQLTALISAADIAVAGTAQVTVFTHGPGGGTSNVLTFTIKNPVPQTTSLNPSQIGAGGPDFTLTVNGSNFVTNSVVRWKGANRPTTFVSSTQLTALISAADIAAGGTPKVTVFNPTPGGGTSNALTFTIINPVPQTTSLSPSQIGAGGPDFTLTVNGSNFVTNSVVRWKGANRPTTFVSPTQLTAVISAADIAAAGTAKVTVFNPTPGGGTSSAQTFTIY